MSDKPSLELVKGGKSQFSASDLRESENPTRDMWERKFEECMLTVRQSIVEAGRTLMVIRSHDFWKTEYGTWATYLKERWGMTTSYALKIIEASKIGTIVPIANEAQARALIPVKNDPEGMRAIMDDVVANAAGTKVTAAAITAKVREYLKKPEPKITSSSRVAPPEPSKTVTRTVQTVIIKGEPQSPPTTVVVTPAEVQEPAVEPDSPWDPEDYERWVRDLGTAVDRLDSVVIAFLGNLNVPEMQEWLETQKEEDVVRWFDAHARQLGDLDRLFVLLEELRGCYTRDNELRHPVVVPPTPPLPAATKRRRTAKKS